MFNSKDIVSKWTCNYAAQNLNSKLSFEDNTFQAKVKAWIFLQLVRVFKQGW